MKFTEDDFRRIYAEMPDEELRSLDRSELNELARKCYDAELAQRGLHAAKPVQPARPRPVDVGPERFAPAPDAIPNEALASEAEIEEEEDLASAAVYTSRAAAKSAREQLQAAAIPAFIEDDNESGAGFRLLVALSYVGQAREVLGEKAE